jgi:hypothetical protein
MNNSTDTSEPKRFTLTVAIVGLMKKNPFLIISIVFNTFIYDYDVIFLYHHYDGNYRTVIVVSHSMDFKAMLEFSLKFRHFIHLFRN